MAPTLIETAVGGLLLDHALTLEDALSKYCERYSAEEPAVLKELREATNRAYEPQAARMVSGPLQGRILATLTSLSRAKMVLELGTFTGYATLCLAEGLERGTVITCEIDPTAADLAQQYFDKSEHGHKISLRRVRASDCIAQARAQAEKFDVVFIDADKKAYYDYLADIIGDTGTTCLLNPGAIIIVDNTLWKGLVLAEQTQDSELRDVAPDPALYGNPARMKSLAAAMHKFNSQVASRPDLQPIIIPLRDGLTLIRYIGKK